MICKSLFKLLFIAAFAFMVSAYACADVFEGLYSHAYGNARHQPILFLHGGPGYNSYSFEYSNADLLASRGYYVIVFDQRGSGRSATAPLSSYTVRNAVADVDAVIAHYKLSMPIVLGHSYGGSLAIEWARVHPSSYKAVILADAPMDQPGVIRDILSNCHEFYQQHGDSENLGFINQLTHHIFSTAHYTINSTLGGEIFWHASHCNLYSPHRSNSAGLEILKELQSGPNSNLLSQLATHPFEGLVTYGKWLTEDLTPQLRSIKRAYGIYGSDDGLFTPNRFKALNTAFQPGHLKFVPDASHSVFIDQRAAFLDFIDEVSTATNRTVGAQ